MTKPELVKAVEEKAGLTIKDAQKAVNALLDTITDNIAKEPITLVGFGTFTVAERAARTGINPQTKEKIEIAASKAPKFKPGKALKDAVE